MDQHRCELPPDPLPQEVWLELDRLKWRCPECGLRWRFFSFDGSSEDHRPTPLSTTRGQWRPIARPVTRPARSQEWSPERRITALETQPTGTGASARRPPGERTHPRCRT